MADKAEINLGKSAEEIAFQLLVAIARGEDKSLVNGMSGSAPDRKWILSTYAECLKVVQTAEYVGG